MTDIKTIIDAEHPWPGLMPFTEEAREYFHGRDREAVELFRLIKRDTLTVLFGQSGLGKSSLLNAGLFPQLRKESYLPVYIRLDVSENSPDLVTQVYSAIKANCEKHNVDVATEGNGKTLWEYFHNRDTDFWSARNQLLTPVLVFDQFEEIFTLGRHVEQMENRCRQLLVELADLIEDRMPDSLARKIENDPEVGQTLDYGKHTYKVVFSFREDYLPEFEELRTLIRPIMLNRMRITRMSGLSAFDAIKQAGRELVNDEVTERIVRFVAAPRSRNASDDFERLEVEPALMSVVCRELNNQRIARGQKQITADLLKNEAQQKIIQNYYISSFADLDPRVREFVEDQLLTDAGYRDSYALDDALLIPGIDRVALDTLIGRRLLRIEERSGVLRIELTHDVLTSVASESRDKRKLQQEAEKRRLEEQLRRKRTRRIYLLAGAAFSITIGIAIVFAVLLNKANEEQRRLIYTQSNVLLSRANVALEENTPSEPYAMIAKAIRLYPENRAALSRAMSLLAQRSHATLVDQINLKTPANISWLNNSQFIVYGNNTISITTPSKNQKAKILDVLSSNDIHADYGLITPWITGEKNISRREFISKKAIANSHSLIYSYLPESKLVAVTSNNRKLHLFDAASYKQVGIPIQLDGIASSVQVSQDKKHVAVITDNNSLYIANLASATSSTLALPNNTEQSIDYHINFITDKGNTLVCSNSGCQFFGSDARQVNKLHDYENNKGHIAYYAQGNKFAIANGNTVTIYSAQGGKALHTITHPVSVRDITFSPGGKYLATASLDRYSRIWNVESGELAGPLLKHHGPVLTVQFGDNANVLATGSTDGAVRIWQPFEGRLLQEPISHADPIDKIRFQPQGDLIMVLTYGQQLNIWRTSHSMKYKQVNIASAVPPRSVVTSKNGQYLAIIDETGNIKVARLDFKQNKIKYSEKTIKSISGSSANLIQFSPDGSVFAVSSLDGSISIFDSKTLEMSGQPLNKKYALRKMEFTPGGKYLATISSDNSVRLWDLQSRKHFGWPMLHRNRVEHIDFTSDNQLIVTAEKDRLYLWEAGTLSPPVEYHFKGEQVKSIAFSSDNNSVIVVLNSRIVKLPLLKKNNQAASLDKDANAMQSLALGDFKLWKASISPNSKKIAIGGIYGRIRLIDTDSLSFIGETMRHDDAILGIEFSHDAGRLLSWSRDRTIKTWDTASGYLVADPIIHSETAMNIALVLNGKAIAVSNNNGTSSVISLGNMPVNNSPEWLPELLENLGGGYLDKNGEVIRIRDRKEHQFNLLDKINNSASTWKTWATRIVGLVANN